jgi:osmotically inducible protein OsmC
MALANILAEAGHGPESVRTTAKVHLRVTDAGPAIARIDLETVGRVPGPGRRPLHAPRRGGQGGCPVSKALAGVPEINLDARLES